MTRGFPDWHELYRQQPTTQMPWYYAQLDPDLARALGQHRLSQGRALDLGTGPGTQAFELARRGFTVTGSDLSTEACSLASAEAAKQGLQIAFVQDDILSSTLSGPFDLVFDRGCFHVLPPNTRRGYVETLASLLDASGMYFLKCFSDQQPGEAGPYRLSPDDIEATFRDHFTVVSIERTVYQGTLAEPPKALFCTLKRA